MMVVRSGSIVFIVIGLLWLIGVISTVLYSLGSQVYSIACLREVQVRSWLALESGLRIGLAHVQDEAELYRQQKLSTDIPYILYHGPWPVDLRHKAWTLEIAILAKERSDHIDLKGTLLNEDQAVFALIWHLEYYANKWLCMSAEPVLLD